MLQLVGQGLQHGVEVAIWRHGERRLIPLHRAIDDGGLEARGVVDHPAQVGAAQGIADLRREAARGEGVGQVDEDRHGFGDELAVVDDGWNLAHRVDREIGGFALLALLGVEHVHVVGRAEVFEQNARSPSNGCWANGRRSSAVRRPSRDLQRVVCLRGHQHYLYCWHTALRLVRQIPARSSEWNSLALRSFLAHTSAVNSCCIGTAAQ